MALPRRLVQTLVLAIVLAVLLVTLITTRYRSSFLPPRSLPISSAATAVGDVGGTAAAVVAPDVFLSFPRPDIQLQCAPNYHSCGSLLAPTSTLPCCNPNSYCYRRPPYFSQCRPRNELLQSSKRLAVRVCAEAWTQCSSILSCCSPAHQCIAVAPSHLLCLPSFT